MCEQVIGSVHLCIIYLSKHADFLAHDHNCEVNQKNIQQHCGKPKLSARVTYPAWEIISGCGFVDIRKSA